MRRALEVAKTLGRGLLVVAAFVPLAAFFTWLEDFMRARFGRPPAIAGVISMAAFVYLLGTMLEDVMRNGNARNGNARKDNGMKH